MVGQPSLFEGFCVTERGAAVFFALSRAGFALDCLPMFHWCLLTVEYRAPGRRVFA